MPLEVQGTFVSQKINKIRWIPEEYVETKCFFTGSWDDPANSVKVWTFESPHEDEDVEYPRTLSEYPVEGDVTEIKFADKTRIAVSLSSGDVKLLEVSLYDKQTPLREVYSWKKIHNFGVDSCSCTALDIIEGDIATVLLLTATVGYFPHLGRLFGPIVCEQKMSILRSSVDRRSQISFFGNQTNNRQQPREGKSPDLTWLSWRPWRSCNAPSPNCTLGLMCKMRLPELYYLMGNLRTALEASPENIATVGEDGNLNILNGRRGDVSHSVTGADSCSLHSVCFIKHTEVITGNVRGHMKIWDLRSTNNKPAASFLLAGDELAATCIIYHPTQPHIILAGSESGAVAIWDLRMNSFPTSLLNAHAAGVTEIQFHPENPNKLLSCSVSGEIWDWNMEGITKSSKGPDNQITTFMPLEDKNAMMVNSLMPALHKPINSLHCDKGRILCGADNEAIYLIKNLKY